MAKANRPFSRLARVPAGRSRARSLCFRNWSTAITPPARLSCLNPTGRRRGKSPKKSPAIAASRRENVTFIFAPTQSLAGSVQVVARVLEVALHKAHELKFPLSRIVDGIASAPLSPPHPDFIQAMGRTNDAIIYGGRAHLFVTGPAGGGKGAGRTATKYDVARLWPPLRRSVQGLQRRFLFDRPDAVQPRARDRDRR